MTLSSNRSGLHRKTREIPAGHIVTGLVLLALAATLALSAIAIGSQPAAASTTWQTRSAAMLALDAIQARPYWDGRNPAVWVGQDPMCLPRYHGRHGWAKADKAGHRFRVQCQPDGSEYAWNEVSHP